MGRRTRTRIDDLLDAWALWLDHGNYHAAPRSVLAKWMEGKGQILPSAGGADVVCAAAFPIEERVEAAVLAIALEEALAADVLRLEYNAAHAGVCERYGARPYNPHRTNQAGKASLLKVSVRTYRSRLAWARNEVERRVAR
ncbi:hypothetical protein F0A16_20580 [Salinicola corii]|uniref:Uncharacterized protein n=1 Tax=Salinicola corii TaxID=2606937 RepID=A0A640WA90_9GAMM|nr:hypothetical protein [Salinicola corii]KAA0015487.1 hypothetical protein F0A16_20580 [Salinicola corii]